MDIVKLKSYACGARQEFVEAVTSCAKQFGMTAIAIEPIVDSGSGFFIAGKPITGAVAAGRNALAEYITKFGFSQAMESAAATWFNWLVSLRYIKVHGYLNHGYRVLSHRNGDHLQPEILEQANQIHLPGLDRDEVRLLFDDSTKDDELYRLLLVAQCKVLFAEMPSLFDQIDNGTELLLPMGLLAPGSLIRNLVANLAAEDCETAECVTILCESFFAGSTNRDLETTDETKDAPEATQLFGVNWLVSYLMDNSLFGRQYCNAFSRKGAVRFSPTTRTSWLANYPDSPLRGPVEYFIDIPPQAQEVLKTMCPRSLMNPEGLSLLVVGPLCGGILLEAYDLFKSLYQDLGYRIKDIPALILQRNLVGMGLDLKLSKICSFALMMKARAEYASIFESVSEPHVYLNSAGENVSSTFDRVRTLDSTVILVNHLQHESNENTQIGPRFEKVPEVSACLYVIDDGSNDDGRFCDLRPQGFTEIFVSSRIATFTRRRNYSQHEASHDSVIQLLEHVLPNLRPLYAQSDSDAYSIPTQQDHHICVPNDEYHPETKRQYTKVVYHKHPMSGKVTANLGSTGAESPPPEYYYHPSYARGLCYLADDLIATGRIGEGWRMLEGAIRATSMMFGSCYSVTPHRAFFVLRQKNYLYRIISVALRHCQQTLSVWQICLDLVLRNKAEGLNTLAEHRKEIFGDYYPIVESVYQRWLTLCNEETLRTVAGPGPGQDPERDNLFRIELLKIGDQRERLASVLRSHIPELNTEQYVRAATHRSVAYALPAGASLIEFVWVNEFDFVTVPAHGVQHWKPARYLAFVLSAGAPEAVSMIDLGEASLIDRMISEYCPVPTSSALRTRDMVARAIRNSESNTVGSELWAAIFKPLLPLLGGNTRLLISPDGQLTRLAFAALPMATGGLVADNYQISYVTTGRDVLRFGLAYTGPCEASIVVCDPVFDIANSQSQQTVFDELQEPTPNLTSRDLAQTMTDVTRLPGTLIEGNAIGNLLGVTPWSGDRALKNRLLQECRSPRILHLATHGFFLPDQDPDLDRELWGQLLDEDGQLHAEVRENPLLRSGLLLAGANTFLRGGVPPEEAGNGVLTALEVTGMDLLGTDLVVLSACQTGLGDVQVGEGVIGLQRAFTIAGAKTIVMSLWNVDDEATRELMVTFYRRLLAGEGKAEALWKAQQELRSRPEYADPYYWAAFVCLGDPGPLAPATPKKSRKTSDPL